MCVCSRDELRMQVRVKQEEEEDEEEEEEPRRRKIRQRFQVRCYLWIRLHGMLQGPMSPLD